MLNLLYCRHHIASDTNTSALSFNCVKMLMRLILNHICPPGMGVPPIIKSLYSFEQ